MGCTDEVPGVEREIELPAAPEAVWDELASLLGDEVELVPEPGGRLHARGPEGERVGVIDEIDRPRRMTFWWFAPDGDGAPSKVEVDLTETAVGTMLRVRETQFDAAAAVVGLLRGPLARARA